MKEINKEMEEELKEVVDSFPIHELRYIDNFTNEEWEKRKKLMREAFVEALIFIKGLAKFANDIDDMITKAVAAAIASYSDVVEEPLTASELQTLFATGHEFAVAAVKVFSRESEEEAKA